MGSCLRDGAGDVSQAGQLKWLCVESPRARVDPGLALGWGFGGSSGGLRGSQHPEGRRVGRFCLYGTNPKMPQWFGWEGEL